MGGLAPPGVRVDPEAGIVYGRRGRPIRGRDSWGYIRTKVEGGGERQAHRIIWEFVHGQIPDGYYIDHINGDPADNRIVNLRLCTNAQNQMNRHAVRGAVPLKGVCLHKSGRYQTQIKVSGKSIYLGLFDAPEAAAEAYRLAALKYFGEFASSNDEANI